MKPFDLSAALRGEPVVTRDGRKVLQVLHVDKISATYSRVVAVIENNIYAYSEEGKYINASESIYDLFMAPGTKKLWIAVKKQNEEGREHHFSSCAFSTKEELIKHMLTCFKEEEFEIKEIEIEV